MQTNLSSKLKFFINSDLILMNAKSKSKIITAYSDSEGKSLEEIFPTVSDREFIYRKNVKDVRNNKDVLQTAYDPSKPTDKLSFLQSFSSIGIRAGFIFLF